MVYMSEAAFDYLSRLQSALDRKNNPMSVDAFLDVLKQIAAPESEALTVGERDFLLENTDLTEDELSSDSLEAARLSITEDRALAEEKAVESTYTTKQVAELLGQHESAVRRSKSNGDLYALPNHSGRSVLYPKWQFAEGKPTPGLSEVIPLFPQYTHPLNIQQFMTEPHDGLDGRSPVQWLAAGGPVEAVASLIDELGYE